MKRSGYDDFWPGQHIQTVDGKNGLLKNCRVPEGHCNKADNLKIGGVSKEKLGKVR